MEHYVPKEYDDFGYFAWRVSNAGYYWESDIHKEDIQNQIDTPKIKGPFLTSVPETPDFKVIYPLRDNPTMFLEFASLDPEQNDMLNFANKYGLLINEFNIYKNTPIGKSADSFEFWERAILGFREAFFLWIAINEKDIDTLSSVIGWDKQDNRSSGMIIFRSWLGKYPGEYRFMYIPPYHEIYRRIVTGDLLFPAKIFLQRLININMDTYPTRLNLYFSEENEIAQHFVPSSLLAAMWFQLSQAVSGNKKFKICKYCGNWEDVTNKKATWEAHPDCANRARVKKSWEKNRKNSKGDQKNGRQD